MQLNDFLKLLIYSTYILWFIYLFKIFFYFGLKVFKPVKFLFSFVLYSLP